MSVLQNLRANVKFSLREPEAQPGDVFRVLPIRRSLVVILFAGAFFVGFCVPLMDLTDMAGTGPEDSLFSVVGMMFTLFWMLGWSTGVGLLGLVLLFLVFGRESIHASPGAFTIRMSILGAGVGTTCLTDEIKELRWQVPEPRSPRAWRGSHVAFDYQGRVVGFACNIDESEAARLVGQLQEAFRRDAPPGGIPVREPEPRVALKPALSSPRQAKPVTLGSPSTLALALANLIPVLGVLFAGWQIGEIMLLFWAESAVIGFYNVCKMWMIGRWSVLFFGPFFIGHYGGFMAVHLLFIYGFFLQGIGSDLSVPLSAVLADFAALTPALIALFVSHGVSFRYNFIARREYEGRKIQQQMGEPYKRIIIMHVTIIAGGFLTMGFSNALPALLLLIALKVGTDLRSHLRERAGETGGAIGTGVS